MTKLNLSLILIILTNITFSQNFAFKQGESLSYKIRYGFFEAGEIKMTISNDLKYYNERLNYHMIAEGKSLGTFDWFFKVRDRYESYIDKDNLLPHLFIRRVNEGGFIINQDYLFLQNKNRVFVKRDGTDKPKNTSGKYYNIIESTHDMISAFYYLRSIDFSKIENGKMVKLNTFFDEEIFPLTIKIIGREIVKTSLGKIRCLKIRPVIQKGRVFKEEEDLTLWISDDGNHIPVRLQAEILVGSIKIDLESYKNLQSSLNISK